jgi:uncharacterized protein (TIGR02996 family)
VSDAVSAIDDALVAARASDWPACLSALLAAWRATKTAELADAIDRASTRAAGPEVARGATGARIAAATDADVGPIVALIRRQVRTQPRFREHALELARSRPPDPRIATVLAELIERAPSINRDGALDSAVVDALDAIDDPHYRQAIVAAAARLEPRRDRLIRFRAQIDHLVAVAARVAGRPPAPASTEHAELAELAELLERRATTIDLDALLAAIYANPADTEARVVYGDALQLVGDPRGELIALQCARAADAPPSRRERTLLATHARVWLGGLEPFVQKSGVEFRRGFVARVRLAVREYHAALADPNAQLLEELDVGASWCNYLAPWFHTLGALRAMWRLHAGDLRSVLGGPVLAWTGLGIREASPDVIKDLALFRKKLPMLAELDLSSNIYTMEFLTAIEHTGQAGRLRRVRVAAHNFIEDVIDAGRRAQIAELEVVGSYSPWRDPDGASVAIAGDHATFVARKPRDVRYLAIVAQQLGRSGVTTASIVVPAGANTAALLQALERYRIQVTS